MENVHVVVLFDQLNAAIASVNGGDSGIAVDNPVTYTNSASDNIILKGAGGTKITNASLRKLTRFPSLTVLSIRKTQVDDAGIEILLSIAQFKQLLIQGSKVSPNGVRRLKVALPQCVID